MLTLYHAPRSRSSRFIWLLEELGVPYEIKVVSIRRGDGSGERDSKNPHPHGKVPAITHDGAVVFESCAVASYLTDAFPENGIGPVVGDTKRGAYLTWLAYYAGVLEPAFTSKFMKIDVPRGTAGWVGVDEAMAHVGATLAAGPYLLGERFSAADVLYGSTFALFLGSPMLPESPVLRAYVDRCTARPAYRRAAAKDAG
jgi:glutathione S-transferase